MKKVLVLSVILLFTTQFTQAQWWKNSKNVKGNGEMTSQNRKVGNYDEVSVSGMMDVTLVYGNEGSIKVEAESNLQEFILTEVENGKLKIYTEKGFNINPTSRQGIQITVPFKDLSGVQLTGSGDIQTIHEIKAKDFSVSLTGSGDVKLELNVKNLEGQITGSGDVSLKGKAENFNCKVTGSGDFHAYSLNTKMVSASILGSGDIEVTATSSLEAKVSGSGDINYKGNPEKENFKSMGSGSVNKQ